MRAVQKLAMVLALICFGLTVGCEHIMTLHNAYVNPESNPPKGPYAMIIKVTDARQFQAKTKDMKIPTVQHSQDIDNSKVTDRAVGRFSNGLHTFYFVYGKKEGTTVETAVEGAVANALRNKGYMVVPNDSADAARAVPVEVVIQTFWISSEIGVWSGSLKAEIQVSVTSPALREGKAATASGSHTIHTGYLVSAIPRNCIRDSLNDLTFDLENKFKRP